VTGVPPATWITADGATPERYVLVLHGILGTRANWRGLARRAVARVPAWGAVLADLREHGEALGRPPPHTVARAADDLRDLDDAVPAGARILGALGHSFGGKVAAAWARQEIAAGRPVERLILVDSTPGPRPDGAGSEMVLRVVRALEGIGPRFRDPAAFVEALATAGQAPLASWLAMNLVREDDGTVRFGPDLDAIRALIDDYFRDDLWPFLESLPDGLGITFVAGAESSVFRGDERARAEALARRAPDRVAVHVVPDAGHWVHTEAPEEMVRHWQNALDPPAAG